MGRKYDIFISYRRDGGIDSAVALKSTLNQMHYRAFLDVDSLRAGPFDTALLRHIEECKDFLLVLSPNALARCVNEDDWVRREIEHAMALGKNIIPIICDGGSVQERMNVPLPDSLADLPRYNVLETNLVQLRAMTQLLRTSLTARPHNPVKGMAVGASIAVVLCVIAFFAAGFVQDYLNTYPRTAKEKNLVEQAISQQSLNLSVYNVAQSAYLKALDDCKLYLSGSPQVSRSELSLTFAHVMDTVEAQKDALKEAAPTLLSDLASSPLSVADLTAQTDFLRMGLDDMYSTMLFLEYQFLDDPYTTSVSKELWVSCYRDLAVLNGDTIVLGINAAFLPLSEESLDTLRSTSLPLMTSLYTGQTWCATEADVSAREENIYKRQQEVLDKLDSDVLQGEAMLEHQRTLLSIQQEVISQERIAEARRRLEEEKKKLEELKAQLYATHRPTSADHADILMAKGLMFLSFDMLDPALESFALYAMSDAPNAFTVANSLSLFALSREQTGIDHGVIVFMYEDGKTPQPDIKIGDIIYAVNGVEVSYVDEYIAVKNGNAASQLQVLRFTDAGYERLNIQLDPDAGLLGISALAYQ